MPHRIQLTRSHTVFEGGESAIASWRAEYRRCHWVKWPGLIEPSLLALLQEKISSARFFDKTNVDVGDESRMKPEPTSAVLEFLTNDNVLFDVVRAITGCGPVGCFRGRVYRLLPNTGQMSDWHPDLSEGRMATLSINLSAEPYQGGILQFRENGGPNIVSQVANTGAGDGVLFNIAEGLEHRVTPLTGTVPRTAYAGWFLREPQFASLLRKRLEEAHATS
jgi:2-oxoglutarate-Fe(II)-dependent oxygenase superfamily protein